MSRYDWIGFAFIALIFVALIWSVPSALHRHSCETLEPGQVEGC